jgi:hypothetical protein
MCESYAILHFLVATLTKVATLRQQKATRVINFNNIFNSNTDKIIILTCNQYKPFSILDFLHNLTL